MACRSYQKQFFTQFSKAQWYSIVRKNTKVWGFVEKQIRDKTPRVHLSEYLSLWVMMRCLKNKGPKAAHTVQLDHA